MSPDLAVLAVLVPVALLIATVLDVSEPWARADRDER